MISQNELKIQEYLCALESDQGFDCDKETVTSIMHELGFKVEGFHLHILYPDDMATRDMSGIEGIENVVDALKNPGVCYDLILNPTISYEVVKAIEEVSTQYGQEPSELEAEFFSERQDVYKAIGGHPSVPEKKLAEIVETTKNPYLFIGAVSSGRVPFMALHKALDGINERFDTKYECGVYLKDALKVKGYNHFGHIAQPSVRNSDQYILPGLEGCLKTE